ncbi:MAG: twin transmembrane helix small protein [Alphaproteobacteria bacterium]|nr:twin transmembrane helix small protein [Alphaproteobacteria bacterium]
MNWLLILIIIGIIITGCIVIFGVASMSMGGKFNRKFGNKLMQARIVSQFITLLFVVLYLLLYT